MKTLTEYFLRASFALLHGMTGFTFQVYPQAPPSLAIFGYFCDIPETEVLLQHFLSLPSF